MQPAVLGRSCNPTTSFPFASLVLLTSLVALTLNSYIPGTPKGLSYILKPVASSRGRGVRVVADPQRLDPATLGECLLQRYVSDPLLIDVSHRLIRPWGSVSRPADAR